MRSKPRTTSCFGSSRAVKICGAKEWRLWAQCFTLKKENSSLPKNWHYIISVSYTHLDVYKRQVESFKSTLDEVREADLLIHVVDISHPSFEDHINSVNQILTEIGANQKPAIMVFNKIDAFAYEKKSEDDLTPETRANISLEEWEKTWMSKSKYPTVFISALTKENFPEMKKMIYDEVLKIHISRFPYNDFLFEYYDNDDESK